MCIVYCLCLLLPYLYLSYNIRYWQITYRRNIRREKLFVGEHFPSENIFRRRTFSVGEHFPSENIFRRRTFFVGEHFRRRTFSVGEHFPSENIFRRRTFSVGEHFPSGNIFRRGTFSVGENYSSGKTFVNKPNCRHFSLTNYSPIRCFSVIGTITILPLNHTKPGSTKNDTNVYCTNRRARAGESRL